MKQKTIIAVYGTANVGKSMTLSSLGRQLSAAGGTTNDNFSKADYNAIFNYTNRIIGVQTFGDLVGFVQTGLDHFLINSCDIITIATKRYGDTVNAVGAFAGNNGYRVIWVAPYEIRDNSITVTNIKDYCASHLRLMIDDIIAGRL